MPSHLSVLLPVFLNTIIEHKFYIRKRKILPAQLMAVILTTQNIGGMSVQFLQQLCGDGHVLRDNGRSARKNSMLYTKALPPNGTV